jgi:Tol biopolymer transport system component
MLHEMASGTRPFRGDTRMSTIGAILKDEPSSITELKPSLPRQLGRIIRRCLAKDPDRRYQTTLDLRNELEELKAEIDSGVHAAGSRHAPARRRRVVLGAVAVLAVVASFAILAWVRREPPQRESSFTSVPLTSGIGEETRPNWSPGGEFITFARVTEAGLDVMVQPVPTGEAVALVNGPGDDTVPRWSPDGRYLAFASTTEPGSPVYLVPPHGGTPRKLFDTFIPTLSDVISESMGDRPWSPDSQTLLASRGAAIYRIGRNNQETEKLTAPSPGSWDLTASYSFDGERIVFMRTVGDEKVLMVIPAAGGEPELIQANAWEPAFRPDGRHLLFLTDRGGDNVNLWELDLETGGLRQLTTETRHTVWSFSVSATNRIAYEVFWHDTFLFEVDVITGERRQLTSHTKRNYGARWSPEGGTIAYGSTRTGNSEIFLHHLDGRPETQLTNDPGPDGFQDWSPNGRQIIFTSQRQDNPRRLFIANSDGGGERLLVDQLVLGPARWSPDDKRIAYLAWADGPRSLWTVAPDGSGARQVIPDRAKSRGVQSFDWYRDSRHGIYKRGRGAKSMMIAVDLETGEEQLLFTGSFIEMDVAPDGSAVAFCFGRGHMSMGLAVLKLEPPADPQGLPQAVGEPEYVVRAEATWHVHNGGWSPDSKSLVYTRDQDYSDIYELVEKE